MRSVPFACLLSAAALGLACDGGLTQPADPPVRPNAAVVSHEHNRDITVGATIECTGEEITLVGNLYQLFTVTDDGAGTLHLNFKQSFTGRGTSELTGVSYLIHETLGDQFNGSFDEGEFSEHTFTITFTVVGKGGAPNEVAHAMQHIVVHPDGTITGFFERVRILCQ